MVRWVLGSIAVFVAGLLLAATQRSHDQARRVAEPAQEPSTSPVTSLDRLAAALRDPDLDRRIDAAVALRKLGKPALPVFIELLREGDDEGCLIAARSLGHMKELAAPTVPDLCDALNRDDPRVRLAVLEALAKIPSNDAIAPLLSMLPDADPKIVEAALKALAAIKPQTKEAALAIAALIDPARQETALAAIKVLEGMGPASAVALPQLLRAFESDALLSPAIEAVQAIGPEAHPAITALIQVIREVELADEKERKEQLENPQPYIGCGWGPYPEYDAQRALVAIGERAVPEVLRMLKDDLSGVRERAGAVLFGIGEPVLPHLLAAATDPDAFVRVEVVGALGECAEGHPELLGTISHLARDPDLDVRVQALVALGRFGADATPVLLKALNDKEPRILDAALAALVRIAPRESSAVPLLVKLLGHTEYTVRWHAADVLAVMGEAAKPAIPALVRCLSHESVHMRMSVADALQKLEDLAIPAVIDGLDDATPEGQQAALVLLLKQEKTSDEIRGAYVRMLASKSTSVRVHAAAAMARTRVPNDSVLPTLLAGLQSKDKETRSAAADGLAALGAEAAGVLPHLLRAVEREEKLTHNSRVLYEDALAAVGRHDIPTLAAALSSPSWNVRYDTAEALKQIGEPAVPALAKMAMTGQSEVIEILRWTARKMPAAKDALEAVAASKDPAVSLAALNAIWYATKDAHAVVPGFLALVAVEKTRSGAAYQLSQVGARAVFAIVALREAHAKATNAEVRRYLADAIDKIERR